MANFLKTLYALASFLCLITISLIFSTCAPEEPPVQIIVPGAIGYEIFDEVIAPASVYGIPQLSLKLQLDEPTPVQGNSFRPVLDDLKLTTGGNEIDGEVVVADDGLSVSFYPSELLPENAQVDVVANAHWEQLSQGTWIPVEGDQGVETFEDSFSTGAYEAPAQAVSSLFPADGTLNQSTTTVARVTFAKKIGDEFEISLSPYPVRLAFDDATLNLGNTEIATSTELNESGLYVDLIPEAFLQGESEYTVIVNTHWEIKRGETWQPLTMSGDILAETIEYTFTTKPLGNIAQVITDNIDYTYPIENQYHFLKLEHNKGFVKLKTSFQNSLFETTGVQLKARFTTPDNGPIEVPLTFDPQTLTVSHSIPATLLNETIYKLEFIRIADGSGNTEAVYATHFRTSMYDTFAEKINSFHFDEMGTWGLMPIHVSEIHTLFLGGEENFDIAESAVDSINEIAIGAAYATGLVKIDLLTETDFFSEIIHPMIYSGYKVAGLKISRDTSRVGVPPLNANYIHQQNRRALTSTEITNNTSTRITDFASFRCTFLAFVFKDWNELRMQAGHHPDRDTNDYLIQLNENGEFPQHHPGLYKFRIKYVLPDGTATFETEIDFEFSPG